MNNRTAIITGGARRIGAAITRELHRGGMDVVVHYNTSESDADSLIRELNTSRPDSACRIYANLQNSEETESFISKACSFNGRIDVLINNAAVFYPTPLATLSEENWNETIDINLKAPVFLSKALVTELKRTGGTIINLTDTYAHQPLDDHIVYNISKAGMIMLTRALAKELAPHIRVNAISPGAILWPENDDRDNHDMIISQTLLKRQGNTTDITSAVHFLVYNADYMTGQVLVIDGGRSCFSE